MRRRSFEYTVGLVPFTSSLAAMEPEPLLATQLYSEQDLEFSGHPQVESPTDPFWILESSPCAHRQAHDEEAVPSLAFAHRKPHGQDRSARGPALTPASYGRE